MLILHQALPAQAVITPSISLREELNDNIFFTEEDKIEDLIYTISPGLEILSRSEIWNASLNGRWDEIYYYDNNDLDTSNQSLDSRIRYRPLSTMSLFGRASYIVDSRRDRDIEETGLVILSNAERIRTQVQLGADWAFTEKDVIALSGAYNQSEFDDPEFEDSISKSANLNLTHDFGAIFPATIGHLNTGYERHEFDDYDISIMKGSIGFNNNISETWSVFVDLGGRYSQTEYEKTVLKYRELPEPRYETITRDKTLDDYGGTGRVAITYQGEIGQTSLNLTHDIAEASGRGGVVNRSSIIFSTRQRLTENFWAMLSANFYLNTAEAGKESVEEIDEESLSIRPAIRLRPYKFLNLELSYRYTQIQDNIDGSDRFRNLVFLQLRLQYPLFE